jgi:hypothetical protein
MGTTAGRLAIAGAAFAGAVGGGLGTWAWTRASAGPPVPAAIAYVNPLAKVEKGELLVLGNGPSRQAYQVADADDWTVLLRVESSSGAGPSNFQELRIARSSFGLLNVLAGDLPQDLAAASVRDFVIEEAVPVDLFVPGLGRTLPCWRFRGRHRVQGSLTIWVSDALPAHGVARMDSDKAKVWEVQGISWGEGK